jgi:hypothetical protein
MHVVERHKMLDSGKTFQVTVTVEDPGAFTMPWSGMQVWPSSSRRLAGFLAWWEISINSVGGSHFDVATVGVFPKPEQRLRMENQGICDV